MSKKKIFIIGLAVTVFLAVLASVLFFVREKKIADSLELNQEEITGLVGDSVQLSLNVDRHAKWSCDNPSIAKVSSNGMVKLLSEGKTTIEVVCMKRSLTCKVVVEDPRLSIEKIYLVPGQEFPVEMTNTSLEASAVPDNDLITYENGKVIGVSPGQSGITFKIKNEHYHCDVIVQDSIMAKEVSVEKGNTKDFCLENAPMNAKIDWKIKDTDIAQIKETKTQDLPINEDGSLKETPEETTQNPEDSGTTEDIKSTDPTKDYLTNDASDAIRKHPLLVAANGERMSDASPKTSSTEEIIYVDGAPEESTQNTTDIEETDTSSSLDMGASEEPPELIKHNEIVVIEAKNVGTTEITATVNGVVYKAKLTVTGDQNLSIKGKYIALGTTKTISIDNFMPSYKVEWTNAKASEKNGEATVFGKERGTITVKAVVDTGIEKKELSKEFVVIEKKLNRTSWSGFVNQSFDLKMQDGQNPEYEFDSEILARDGSHFTAMKAGTTTIHVKDGKTNLTCEVVVRENQPPQNTTTQEEPTVEDSTEEENEDF